MAVQTTHRSNGVALPLSFALAAALAVACQTARAQPPERAQSSERAQPSELAGKIDRLVQPYLDGGVVMGMTVGAIQGDTTVVRGYGRVAADQPTAPTGQTVYEIGSITKTFTGLLLADAVVDGRLRLDQKVAELMPRDVSMPQHQDGPILLKHLATHASGLPRLPGNLTTAAADDPYGGYGRDDLYAFLSAHEPQNAPGKAPEYSNLGFGLLGQLLADHADTSYDQLVRSTIAEPLGMEATGAQLTAAMRARAAPPHDADLAPNHHWTFQAMAGAGAVKSTADDMVRYARAHLHPPQGQLGKAIELAWQVHQPAQGQGFAVGLGWHVARDGATRWHNGQTGGYHAMVMINRQLDSGVVVLANTATMEVDVLGEQLLRMLAGASEQPRAFPKTVDVSPEQMRRLEGRYQLVPGFVLTVKIEGQKLMVGATGQPSVRVYPESDTRWNYRVVDAALTFELGDTGPASAVVLHQNGLDQRAERIE